MHGTTLTFTFQPQVLLNRVKYRFLMLGKTTYIGLLKKWCWVSGFILVIAGTNKHWLDNSF
ncbi:hypothetical protein O9929_12875 [Vibrio lentus]|nr:hypothetical protein [Vibrio lentus]